MQDRAQRRAADNVQPLHRLAAGFPGEVGKLALRVQRQPKVFILSADRTFKLAVFVGGHDCVGKTGGLGCRRRRVEPERCGKLRIAFVGQPVGECGRVLRPVGQNLLEEGLVVDIGIQPKGPQGNAQEPAVGHQLVGGLDRANCGAKIVGVAHNLG